MHGKSRESPIKRELTSMFGSSFPKTVFKRFDLVFEKEKE